MAKRSPKPVDVNQRAAAIVDAATRERGTDDRDAPIDRGGRWSVGKPVQMTDEQTSRHVTDEDIEAMVARMDAGV